MTAAELLARLHKLIAEALPLPATGSTAQRHRRLFAIGRENLSLARLAEAHWDAVAILAEAGRSPVPGALYGVWASEHPRYPLTLAAGRLSGSKPFCSGAGLLSRALVTVTRPEPRLVDLDLQRHRHALSFDHAEWRTPAFAETQTARVTFLETPVEDADLVGPPNFYLDRPGFWHGACGPAACWAGGAARLIDFARHQTRSDPHTVAHLGAMHAAVWALEAYLEVAGHQIDRHPYDIPAARIRARTARHLIEQAATEIIRRLPRAYGPHPLAFDEVISRHYQELDLYLRQSHAERDLEALGRDLLTSDSAALLEPAEPPSQTPK